MPHRAPAELKELALRIGKFMEYWGFKRIHGQIWTFVFLAKEPIDATTLTRRLGVSKALVSLAIKDLLQYQVIQVAGKGSRRRVLYQSNPDIFNVITLVLQKRERVMMDSIQSAFEATKSLDTEDPACDIDREKLTELGDMIADASSVLDTMIESQLTAFLPHRGE
ncbi:MAG: hypothetical protein N2578_02035 [Bdellovibrionaceae bacterium]|nr:hypothetical protein [Pseudobdellovibrionaceae bacterium]